jgi:hypothetical protein
MQTCPRSASKAPPGIDVQTQANSRHPFSRRELRPPAAGQFVDDELQRLDMVITQRWKLPSAACGDLFRQLGEQGHIIPVGKIVHLVVVVTDGEHCLPPSTSPASLPPALGLAHGVSKSFFGQGIVYPIADRTQKTFPTGGVANFLAAILSVSFTWRKTDVSK